MYYKTAIGLFLLSLFMIACLSCSSIKTGEKDTQDKTIVIAHRGGAKLAPENTIAAIKNAIRLGVDMIEIDVHQTSDSVVVVIHDDSIDKTTDGSGLVKELTLSEIKKYDAGSWFSEEFKGEKIPTLDEVMEVMNGRAVLLIEIKDGMDKYPGLERRVVEAVHKHDAIDWCIVQSFNKESILKIKEFDSSIVTYRLLGKDFEKFYKVFQNSISNHGRFVDDYDGIAAHHSKLNSQNIDSIKQAGFGFFSYTINESDEMVRLINAGLDGIITDVPDTLQNVIIRMDAK